MDRSTAATARSTSGDWPSLPFEEWKDTYATLHMWTQIVGKVRLVNTPWINHSWHATLYVTPRGLTTSPIPYGARTFQIDFDFVDHALEIATSAGETATVRLGPRSVADFYEELMGRLRALGLETRIHTTPNELPDPVPFESDHEHASYDAEHVGRLRNALVQSDRVFKQFRVRFAGKCSPVHFFWGSFDLAVTRFSGRPAPEHPGGVPHLPDWVTREAYSHEVSSCGFWPGSEQAPEPVFYSYAYPEPEGFRDSAVRPGGWSDALREFVLPYEEVRSAESPDEALLDFMQSTYEAAANCGAWPRSELEMRAIPGHEQQYRRR